MRVELYMSCPLCMQETGIAPKEYWTHNKVCGGRLWLDQYANIHCARCGKYTHMMNVELTCNSGRHVFCIPTTSGYAAAVGLAATMGDERVRAWLKSVLDHI